ncbi:hypothetical protein BC940DRAFT_314141 [Gongronella butleri]|nr:hypothetical protein BC940DRAFT_314141 [Gongronella butleri]
MAFLSQTWFKLTRQLKRKRSFQSQDSGHSSHRHGHHHHHHKVVRFQGVDAVYYTHSSLEYDRTPTAEATETDIEDDDEEEEDGDDDDALHASMLSTQMTKIIAQPKIEIPFLPTHEMLPCLDDEWLAVDSSVWREIVASSS